MENGLDFEAAPERIAVYRRVLPVSLARVWENVYDWEHLPWLHRESFSAMECEDSGPWGWRARVRLPPAGSGPWLRIELCVDRSAQRYVTRTLEGPGTGTEIWTSLRPVGSMQTAIEVSFHLPGPPGPDLKKSQGAALMALYSRLWDQDEAMMVERDHRASSQSDAEEAELSLGGEVALRAQLPKRVSWRGSSVWIYIAQDQLRAASLVCPHWTGPLSVDPQDEALVVCPWHGYRFDLRTGRSCDGRGLRLLRAPAVVVEAGEVFLRSPGS